MAEPTVEKRGTEAAAQVAGARTLLEQLNSALAVAIHRTALLCEGGEQLEPARLDAYQGVCYELAWSHAELVAAGSLECGQGVSEQRAALAMTFTAEAVVSVLGRLASIYAGLSLDDSALQRLLIGRELRELRRFATTAEQLAQLGRAVAADFEELTEVAVDEDTAMARLTFRRFAQQVVAPLAESIHREDLTVPESILQPLREMGVFGLSIPEQYGGSAPTGRDNAPMVVAVTEALSEASLAAAGSLITRPEILTRALLAGGTEAQKRHWLPRIARGDPLCAIGMTEPDYGSDVASLALRATASEGGWLVNGAKSWCTFAGKAGLLMVLARTHPDRSLGHRGLSLLLVEKPSYDGHDFTFTQPQGGTLHGRAIATIGYRGMHSFDLTFDDFFVPRANVIGEEAGLGKGFYLTMAGMTGGRIQTAGRALGVMRAAIKAAIQYAKDRKVFNAPLLEFPLTRMKLVSMAARFTGCRALAFAVARQLDQGAGALEASLAKLLACRSAEIVTREAQQIHGGMGYAEETAVSRYWLDARVLSIFEGTEETLALKVIARGLLESARSKRVAPC